MFAKNVPRNEAFAMPLNIIDANDTSIATLFKYHTLAPFVRAADFWNGPHNIQTTLVEAAFTNLSGGQVVVGNGSQDLQYDGGIVHIIDKFLTIPPSALEILSPLGLTAAEGVTHIIHK